MTSKRASADDARRHLAMLRRLDGLLFADPQGLWLLTRPTFDAPHHEALAHTLLHTRFSSASQAAAALHAADVLPVTSGRLGSWAYAIKRLESQRALGDWIGEGLKGFKGLDVDALTDELARARARLEHVSAWHLRTPTLLAHFQGAREPDVLACAWRAHHELLGAWPGPATDALGHIPDAVTTRAEAVALGWARRRSERAQTPASPECASAFLTARTLTSPHEASWLATSEDLWRTCAGLPDELFTNHAHLPTTLHLLYGPERAANIMRFLAAPYLATRDARRDSRARLDAWLHKLTLLDAGTALPEVAALSHARPYERHTLLARSFLDHVVEGARVTGVKPIARHAYALLEASPSLADAGAALGARWLGALPHFEDTKLSSNLLAIALTQPDASLTGLKAPLPSATARAWADALRGLPRERAETVWDACQPHLELLRARWSIAHTFRAAINAGASPEALVLLSELELWGELEEELLSDPVALDRYVRVVRALRARLPNVSDPFWAQSWFLALFRERSGWVEPFLYAAATSSRDAGATAHRISEQLVELSQAVRLKDTHIRGLLARWQRVPDTLEPENVELANALWLPHEEVAEYLHHRDLLGHGRTFSDALAAASRELHKRDRERLWLARTLEDPELASERRDALTRRHARLLQEEETLRESRRRAGRRFARALERCRQDSLATLLDAILRRALARLVPAARLPARLDPRWLTMLGGLEDERVERAHLELLARQGLFGELSAPNQAFLERPHGRAWAQGMSATIELGGETHTIATSSDALESLHMGTYFDTCLSLRGGENAASAVTNALDANKHVVYVRDGRGVVVGRKLICLTQDARVLGFQVYSSRDSDDQEMRDAVDQALLSWFDTLDLVTTNHGTPESLHGAFWYDDGAWSWPARAEVHEVLEGWPQDASARAEWMWSQAQAEGNPEALRAAMQTPVERYALAARMALWRAAPEAPTPPIRAYEIRRLVQAELFATRPERMPAWMKTLTFYNPEDATPEMLSWMGFQGRLAPTEAARLMRSVQASARRAEDATLLAFFSHEALSPWKFADTATKLEGYALWQRARIRHECDPPCAYCLAEYDDLAAELALAVTFEGSERVFARALEQATGWQLEMLLHAAARLPSPRVRRVLAARAGETSMGRNGTYALASHGLLEPDDPRLAALAKEGTLARLLHDVLPAPESRLALAEPWLEELHKAPRWALETLGQELPRRLLRAVRRQIDAAIQAEEKLTPWLQALAAAGLHREADALHTELERASHGALLPFEVTAPPAPSPGPDVYACVTDIMRGSRSAWATIAEIEPKALTYYIAPLTQAAPPDLEAPLCEHMALACMSTDVLLRSFLELDLCLTWMERARPWSEGFRAQVVERCSRVLSPFDDTFIGWALIRTLGDPSRAESVALVLGALAEGCGPRTASTIADMILNESGAPDALERAEAVLDACDWASHDWAEVFEALTERDGWELEVGVRVAQMVIARMQAWDGEEEALPERRRVWWVTALA